MNTVDQYWLLIYKYIININLVKGIYSSYYFKLINNQFIFVKYVLIFI